MTNVTMPAAAVTVTANFEPIPPVNTTALNNRINALQGTQRGNFTEASWNAFQNALTNARAVAANPNATQAQVDDALRALDNAFSSLVENNNNNNNFFRLWGRTTRWERTFWHWILLIFFFGWIWFIF